jgi:hypothetical protein
MTNLQEYTRNDGNNMDDRYRMRQLQRRYVPVASCRVPHLHCRNFCPFLLRLSFGASICTAEDVACGPVAALPTLGNSIGSPFITPPAVDASAGIHALQNPAWAGKMPPCSADPTDHLVADTAPSPLIVNHP